MVNKKKVLKLIVSSTFEHLISTFASIKIEIKIRFFFLLEPPSVPVLFYRGMPVSPYTSIPSYSYPDAVVESVTGDNEKANTGDVLNLREKKMVQMHCVQITWAPPLHPPHWFVGGLNLTDRAQLYMKSIAEQVRHESLAECNSTSNNHAFVSFHVEI